MCISETMGTNYVSETKTRNGGTEAVFISFEKTLSV